MSWALPFLFMRLIANLHSSTVFASSAPQVAWILFVVCLAFFFIRVRAGRPSVLPLRFGFQSRAVQGVRSTPRVFMR